MPTGPSKWSMTNDRCRFNDSVVRASGPLFAGTKPVLFAVIGMNGKVDEATEDRRGDSNETKKEAGRDSIYRFEGRGRAKKAAKIRFNFTIFEKPNNRRNQPDGATISIDQLISRPIPTRLRGSLDNSDFFHPRNTCPRKLQRCHYVSPDDECNAFILDSLSLNCTVRFDARRTQSLNFAKSLSQIDYIALVLMERIRK